MRTKRFSSRVLVPLTFLNVITAMVAGYISTTGVAYATYAQCRRDNCNGFFLFCNESTLSSPHLCYCDMAVNWCDAECSGANGDYDEC